MDAALKTYDREEQATHYQEAVKILNEDAPWVWLFDRKNLIAVNTASLTTGSTPAWGPGHIMYHNHAQRLDRDRLTGSRPHPPTPSPKLGDGEPMRSGAALSPASAGRGLGVRAPSHRSSPTPDSELTGYLLQRLFHALTIILGISLLVFVFVELAPGDAVDSMLPPEAFASAEAKERLRESLGLDDPAPLRYVRWLGRTATGDLGYSLTSQKPITEMIRAGLPTTLHLVGFALVFSIVVGVSTGIIAAIKQYSWIDYLTTFFSFFWLSIPGFFLGC